MDRRQRKTREAIFSALTQLLSQKSYHRITVGDIIERADIGRATFYAHFETKDDLLKALSEELFCHIFDAAAQNEEHRHIFACDTPPSAFEHLFAHLQQNDHRLLDLLSCRNNDLFWGYFQTGLTELVKSQQAVFETAKPSEVSSEYWTHHVVSALVATIRWWIADNMRLTPAQITRWFLASLQIAY